MLHCIPVKWKDREDLEQVLGQLEREFSSCPSAKERAAWTVKLLQQLGEQRGISLKWNKRPKRKKEAGEPS